MYRLNNNIIISIITFILFLLTAIRATAQDETSFAEITDSTSTIVVADSINDIGWDFSILSYSATKNKNKNRRTIDVCVSPTLEAGWCCPLGAPAEAGYKIRRSRDFSFELLKIRYRSAYSRNVVSLGMGFNLKHYGSKVYSYYEDDVVLFGEYPEGVEKPKTTMSCTYFMFPLAYTHKFRRSHQQLGFSVIPGFLLRSKIHNEYKTTAGKAGDIFDVDARQFSLDLRATWYPIDHFGVFVKYSPLAPLSKPSPQFNPLSFGFSIGF